MSRHLQSLVVVAGLLVVTLLAYRPALSAGFIWNDRDYVTAPELRSTGGLGRIWFEIGATEQYYPLLHSAFWVQHRLWGDDPRGYHALNILLHAANAALVFFLVRRLAIPGAALAAFVFALHPIYVESVAWISEQKNTLSLFLYLAAAWLYLEFDDTRRWRTYLAAAVVFLAALLCKSVTAMLPPALLVLFWWRRGRLDLRRDVAPLAPWFVLGAAMGLFSAWVEKKYIGAEGAEFALDAVQRMLLAGRIPWFYAGKLVWPAELIFIYPRWQVDAAAAGQWLFPLATLALLAALWALRRRTRAPLAAALFFGGSLFPVLGFFNVYAFLFSFVADHWQYLPSLGLVVLGCAGLTRLLEGGGPWWRNGIPVALVAGLAALSFHQSRMYADIRTFYAVTVARNPTAWMAHNNLGNLLREDGRLAEAIGHFQAALRVRPDLAKAHYNLANCLRDLKRPEEALPHYRRAIALDPKHVEAHNNLGRTLRETGRLTEALETGILAVRLDNELDDARNNLGMTLRELGRLPEAVAQFERAVRLNPRLVPARLNLALTLSLLGRNAEAGEHYREARQLDPRLPELRF